MDLIGACLLLVLWFIRPQDIFSVIGGVSLVKYLMYFAIFATIRRKDGLSFSKIFKTPIDYLMAFYCIWIIYATSDRTTAAKEAFNFFAFHVVTALALSNWNAIRIYLNCWMLCLGGVAALAISTKWGFELVGGSAELTLAFHDRLTLNTWIFRNPNALGHGVVAAIPAGVAWFLMSGGANRVLGCFVISVVANCVWLTQSKGAFMAGAGGLLLVSMFKRPLWIQLAVILTGWGAGFALLMMLPRMETLNKNDEGIQGRMIVWQQAKASMEATITGEGLKTFQGFIPIRVPKLHRTIYMPIATHGSYVRNGADLGYIGLMLYISIFYAGARTLIQSRTPAQSLPRKVQTTLFALTAVTSLSVWMCDRAYHTDYFLLAGALSAFYRLVKLPSGNQNTGLSLTECNLPNVEKDRHNQFEAIQESTRTKSYNDSSESPPFVLSWNRLGLIDVVLVYILMRIVIYYWNLLSTDFIVF